ncbi:MAG: 5'/3'-nucleotidase SurE [Acidimicrobiales bacterium]
MRRGSAARTVVAGLVLAGAAACSASSTATNSSSSANGPATTVADIRTPGTTVAARPLRILVTNDDGVGAPGIDAVVEGLRALPSTEVVVVAPATNQSGTGGRTTEGEVAVSDATTASGVPAKAVAGYPADTVAVAIDRNGIPWKPDLVVSGINAGQNLGPATKISGTVGAAQAAAKRGVPALAASQGLTDQPDFPGGVQLVTEWVQAHRAALLAGTAPLQVVNLNVPTCTVGTRQDTVEVPVAADFGSVDITKVDCNGTGPVTDDVTAFVSGHATLSELPPAA